MLLRLAALGALGYAGYKYYNQNRDQVDGALRRLTQGGGGGRSEHDVALAGGPLSSDASVVHSGERAAP